MQGDIEPNPWLVWWQLVRGAADKEEDENDSGISDADDLIEMVINGVFSSVPRRSCPLPVRDDGCDLGGGRN
ncbi:hypothetical protein JQ582_41490 [Bradyrhizobium japonicum]|uniref:hypothetical protein n=1 Tax=Bradyrhizobium japonicum TaxID=375 RepID=UPI001BA7544A|nr:hypothetical protein [Bradyrhizobium japonicum]MBR0728634.1 hypothetical protein [Bradyrhizobium japonicum]MBR0750379.1 hypothetical protein [Bradyrhizobium japonicum]